MKDGYSQDINYSLSGNQYLSDLSYNRLFVIGLTLAMAFIFVAFKLVSVTFITDIEDNSNYSENNNFYMHRKEIVDRNGVLLAVNLATASLYAKPKFIYEPKEVAKKLVSIFPDLNYANLVADFSGDKKFVWIKRNISPKEQYAVNNLGIPGIDFEKGERRIYLQENLLSHILGYVDVDGKGIAGIEKYFDKFLVTDPMKSDNDQKTLNLTIDVRVQHILHDVLSKAVADYRAEGASGVIMNVNNGEIYGMVSLPDFDPHNASNSRSEQLFNRATLGVFELGSILKLCTIAMALDTKSVALNDVYYVKDPVKAAKFKITDYRGKHTWLSVPEIFMYSSNIGTARIILETGMDNQKKFLKKFGLTDKLSVEIPEKGLPILPAESYWNEINTMTISYGYGIAISPLHFAQITSALVNGGYLYPATLIKGNNDSPDKKIQSVVSPDTSDKVRKLMRLIVTNGSGRRSEVKGYLVGGKTGSANKPLKGGYNEEAKLSSYVAAFPMNEPKFLVMIMLDSPKAETKHLSMGGIAVAPLAREIIEKIGPILGVKPVNEQDEEIKSKLHLDYKTDSEILESF
jgi:cell division protein FtsI (penicillin-binding protein 3)